MQARNTQDDQALRFDSRRPQFHIAMEIQAILIFGILASPGLLFFFSEALIPRIVGTCFLALFGSASLYGLLATLARAIRAIFKVKGSVGSLTVTAEQVTLRYNDGHRLQRNLKDVKEIVLPPPSHRRHPGREPGYIVCGDGLPLPFFSRQPRDEWAEALRLRIRTGKRTRTRAH